MEELAMQSHVAVVSAALFLSLSACSGPGVREAIGTGAEAAPVVVRTSESAVTIENHAGRPLLNVRVAIDATGAPAPFVRVISSIDSGQTVTLPLTDFRTEEEVALDPVAAAPKQVTVKARDTLTKSYEVTAAWR
jgi:hypothetical protein